MQKINFENLPTHSTPLNATNLNQLQTNVENAINGVVESGENANGNYVKYADGTMICYKNVTGSTAINISWGDGYTTGNTNTIDLGSFPATFVGNIPTVNLTATRALPGTFNYWVASLYETSLSYIGKTSLLRFTSSDIVYYNISVIAIGKWK